MTKIHNKLIAKDKTGVLVVSLYGTIAIALLSLISVMN